MKIPSDKKLRIRAYERMSRFWKEQCAESKSPEMRAQASAYMSAYERFIDEENGVPRIQNAKEI